MAFKGESLAFFHLFSAFLCAVSTYSPKCKFKENKY